MKYNKSEIMKNAWSLYRGCMKMKNNTRTFGSCLKQAWASAKKDAAASESLKGEVEKTYKGHTVYMIPALSDSSWIINGDTYPIKNMIKKFGFTWNRDYQRWYTNDREVAATFARCFAI